MTNEARVRTGFEAMELLARAWTPHAKTPMEEHTWLATCAELLAEPSALIVAFAGPQDQPDALAAFVRHAGLTPRLEQLGVRELHEPSDFVHGQGDALRAVVRAIGETGLPVHLPRFPCASPALAILRDEFGRGIVTRPVAGAPFLPLEKGVDPATRLSSSLRSDLRRARRRAVARGAVAWEVTAPTTDSLPGLLDEVIRVEAAGWKGRERSALAADRKRGWLFRVYAHRATQAGKLRLAFLRINGETAAVQFAVETANRFWLLKIGYDERFSECSPGMLLMEETLRWAAARDLEAYELLGQSERWTRRWTAHERECVAVRAYTASGAGIAALGSDAARFAWQRLRRRR